MESCTNKTDDVISEPGTGSVISEPLRWAIPPSADTAVIDHVWPLNIGHPEWIANMRARHGFGDDSAVLRHLIFVANQESSTQKRIIFKVTRCLHCTVGRPQAGSGGIPKVDASLQIYAFQMSWLLAVQKNCGHKSVDKTVRILVNFYRMVVQRDDGEFEDAVMKKNNPAHPAHPAPVNDAAPRRAISEVA